MSTSLVALPPLGVLVFDAATVEFDEQVNITEHPVTGRSISDHAQRLPSTITITATISETPFADRTNGVPLLRRANALIYLDTIAGNPALMLPAQEVIISTEQYGAFSGYMLQSYRHALDGVKRALIVMTFRQIRKATTNYVSISASAAFASGVQAGEQATSTVGAATATSDTTKTGSILYGLVH